MLNSILSTSFSTGDVSTIQSSKWWSNTNPPAYLQNARYGTFAVLAVDWTSQSQIIYKDLSESSPTVSNTKAAFIKFAALPGVKFTAKGPFGSVPMSSFVAGDWNTGSFLFPSRSSTAPTPFAYNLNEFRYDNAFHFANELRYVKVECSPKGPPKIVKLKLTKFIPPLLPSVASYAPVVVQISPISGSGSFTNTYTTNSELQVAYGSSENLKVTITSKVGAMSMFAPDKPNNKRSVNIEFTVDGAPVPKGLKECHSTSGLYGNICQD